MKKQTQQTPYMGDLKALYENRLNLGPAYVQFAERLRAASIRDSSNFVLAQAADQATKGALAYEAGDEENGKESIENADTNLVALYTFSAGSKRIGREGFKRTRPGTFVQTAQRAGHELYAKFRLAQGLKRQLEAAQAELGGLEEFVE